MARVTWGGSSWTSFAAALLVLAWMWFCRLMILTTEPEGSGKFRGMGHLGWRIGAFLMIGLVPLACLIGCVLALIGIVRGWADRKTAVTGLVLNGVALLLSPLVFYWGMAILQLKV
jgi:hypothetical protein